MNNQLIEKVIKTHYKTCPPMNYDNPLIDREVASALSKSFLKILNLSNQRNLNSNLRSSVLGNSLMTDSTDKNLDKFLMRNAKDLNKSSKYEYSVNPEIVQSLLNLNEGNILELISGNVLHLGDTNKHLILLKSLWNNNSTDSINLNDMSIKIKSEIEHTLLEICHRILIDKDLNLEDLFETDLTNLAKKCAKSSQCFQICCNIFNCLLIETNFNFRIENFIPLFIIKVQSYSFETISVLYPNHLGHIVLLMDINIDSLPDSIKTNYIQKVVTLLKNLKIEFANDVIMLLSHFPHWFNVYLS
ncbi:hypothetical protein K1T71_013567 [Dendrolimus kikuchii]|uniref:Uncharacterized protein n=1 Tax=Dendrolimus kikuchii TaxID=765133 RepID=A0ACC1CGT5_9NEOP|nr:hypothetical protein K1T71_013567 [Dendrolimus kikuchii]